MEFKQLEKLSGDASFRKFYRHKKNKSIIVYCKKEKFKNLIIYEAVNRFLKKNNINTPKLISENYKKNFIEIEDLGNLTGLEKYKSFKINNYKKLFKILKKIQNIKPKKIKTLLKKIYKIPIYSDKLLLDEAKLFSNWYLPTKIKKNETKVLNELNKILKKVIRKLMLKKRVLVHRDFHISNIMLNRKKIYLIDTQDLIYGNPAYDVASLIDDVRFKISLKNREILYKKFILKEKKNFSSKLRNDFEILSTLRNLKIIGIFTRLSKRDKKYSYVKMIPYAWQMIEERLTQNRNLYELKSFFDRYFPKNLRI
ncbi:phosphotransferase [Candidatus Pelagibacter sp.]|nr:phosphotransferase [Candidatus Pelagibacter sp.]